MRILTVSYFSPLWKRYPADVLDLEEGPSIGGGEENFLRCSTGLRALGHEVVAYHCGERGVWRGVEFRTLEDPLYPVIVGEKWDAIAAWSGLRALEYARPGVKRLFVQQLNDLSNLGDWGAVDCIVSPSLDHTKEVRKWGWEGRQAYVHNGCDVDMYRRAHHSGLTAAGAAAVQGPNRKALFIGGEGWSVSTGEDAPKWEDRPMDVGYWSSPDRGLHHLLRAWPTVVKLEPRARLHVFYEIKNYLKFIHILPASFYGERGQTVARLVLDRMYDPTITFHGHVPRKKLATVQKQCRVMCYPYEAFGYCEGFCGSLNQGLAAGCLAMSTARDALPSLYGDAVHWLDKDSIDLDYPEWLAEQIVQGLHGKLPDQEAIRARGPKRAYTWDAATLQMEAVCRGEWL